MNSILESVQIPKLVFRVLVFSLLVMSSSAMGQAAKIDDKTIDSGWQSELIDSIETALNEIYVFPDIAKKMGKHLRKQFKQKKYAELTSLRDFTAKLTEDMHEINHDKHLAIRYISDEMIAQYEGDTLTDQAEIEELKNAQRDNFGFKEVKILNGNIGYIDFRYFADASKAGATAIAAMNFLAYTDAIIFDLRENGGGSPSMIQLISSYLFEEPVHLNSFYVRETDSVQQFWTQSFVSGPRMSDADVYVLTSDYTFSGAEEFSFNIQNQERGMIVGEITGGGAHPTTRRVFANLNARLSLPFGKAINPISGTNWEGTGVKPDIEAPQEQAFDIAYMEALKKIKERTTDKDQLFIIQWALDGKEAMLNKPELDDSLAQKYIGIFGPRVITFENGELYYQRESNPRYNLIPMSDNRFMLDGLDYFRIQLIEGDDGQFDELIGLYDNGQTDSNKRTK